jgi:AcrR family transcriptional regulator
VAAPPLRADAARNLELILEAAEEAFAEKGNDACVADIATRAGVGQATIFRRFQTKDDLIGAVFERKVAKVDEALDAACRKRDAWEGVLAFMKIMTEMQARDRGVFEGFAERLKADPARQKRKQEMMSKVEGLVERAKAEGTLRSDITVEDIHALTVAAAQAATMGPNPSMRAAKRYLAVITDGMRAGAA